MAIKTIWTKERTSQLIRLHKDGWSYKEIADLLGDGLTKNAISGKFDRMRKAELASVAKKLQKQAKRKSILNRSKKADPARVERRKIIITDMASSKHIDIANACGWSRMSDLTGFCNKHGIVLRDPVEKIEFRHWKTEDKIVKLQELIDSGLTNKQIATEVGYTVKSVVRILARHGINGKSQATTLSTPLAKRQPTKLVRSKKVSHIDVPAFSRSGELITIDTLATGDCKWPIGDVRNDDFHFCGHPHDNGSVYCSFHRKKAKR